MHFKTRLKHSNTLIDLTPLVDVVFLMLIFFIVTSDILPLKSLPIENPSLSQNSPPLTTELLIVMDAERVLYLGSKKKIVDFDSLKQELEKELIEMKQGEEGIKTTVVLSIDKHVEYDLFLRLFSIVRECCTNLRLVYHYDSSLSAHA